EAGVGAAECAAEAASHAIASPDAWWRIVMGSGYRGTVDQLDPPARERVRSANLRYAEAHGVRAIRADVVYAVARKPAKS
ncbi:MAG TPA: ubiquinone biosynthesis protein UbiE, partial [Verrucomicrobiae bacterium]|nr:ubiquinone biosynthesis protein UbiE [Verrucomicrobiae bacterium]